MSTSSTHQNTLKVTQRPQWQALCHHAAEIKDSTLRTLFHQDPLRASQLTTHSLDLYFDYSKQKLTSTTLDLLCDLASACEVPQKLEAMFRGDRINHTENRSVLHTALRRPRDEDFELEGQAIHKEIHAVFDRLKACALSIRNGEWLGFSGKPIQTVINVGIGGSDLGPKMAYEALKGYSQRSLTFHFVSNVDGDDFAEKVKNANPETTLFLIASKTFTTQETMTNAQSARQWILKAYQGDQEAIKHHFIALSTNLERAQAFGVDARNIFGFWEWVGGRYSMFSAIGLSTLIAIGPEAFDQLLEGAYEMDVHVQNTPLRDNLPALLALIGIWNRNFLDAPSLAILPYSQNLSYFSAYLQQLEMESTGKSVDHQGQAVEWATCPILWGEPGTNGQHAFYQMIHQGTDLVPVDFFVFGRSTHDLQPHHDYLVANVFAQARALAFGLTKEEVINQGVDPKLVPFKVFEGDRPSSLMMAPQLTPNILGKLVALYEHKVFIQSVIWDLNAFDQWGVELGKVLAKEIIPHLDPNASQSSPSSSFDSSTQALINHYHRLRKS